MLNDKVIAITGAAGRVGAAVARAAAAAGANVVLVDVAETRLAALSDELGGVAIAMVADACTPVGADEVINAGVARFGRIDAAVHSAYPRSAGWGTRFEDLQPQYLAEDLARQLGGAILFSQRLLAHFKRQGHGNLVHIASIQGIAAPKFEHYEGTSMVSPIEYSAIKSGLIAMTRYLAKYYKGCDIRVNCVSCGGILDGQPQVFLDKYQKACNSKGMLNPEHGQAGGTHV